MMRPNSLTASQLKEELLLSQQGDQKAKEKVLQANLALVHSIARRFLRSDYEMDDLVQIGCIGLLKAIEKFDFNYEVKFSTYAVPMIMGEIRCYLRDHASIKISRNIKQLAMRILKEKEALLQKLGREPKISEIAACLQLNREEVVCALEAVQPLTSLDQTCGEEECCLLDRIFTTEGADDWLNKMVLKNYLQALDEREKKLIILRFFHNKTQSQTAQYLGMSQVQVSRLEKKIIEGIKEQLN